MKRIIALLFCVLTFFGALTGCGLIKVIPSHDGAVLNTANPEDNAAEKAADPGVFTPPSDSNTEYKVIAGTEDFPYVFYTAQDMQNYKGDRFSYSIYRYTVATEKFEEFLPRPCTQGIVLAQVGASYNDVLYVASDDTFIAVDLNTGSRIEALCGRVDGVHFFSDIPEGSTQKVTTLYTVADNLLGIELSDYNILNNTFANTSYYLYECVEKRFAGPYDTPWDIQTQGLPSDEATVPQGDVLAISTLADADGWEYAATRYSVPSQKDATLTVIARSTSRGDYEELYRFYGTGAVLYVEDSYEESGETALYFMLEDQKGKNQYSLWRYDLAGEYTYDSYRFGKVLAGPCSNMLVFTDVEDDYAGLGWILYNDIIVPVKLAEGTTYEGMAMSVEMLGGLAEIGGHFFQSPEGSGYSGRYASLTPAYPGAFYIEVVDYTTDGSLPDKTATIQYDSEDQILVS